MFWLLYLFAFPVREFPDVLSIRPKCTIRIDIHLNPCKQACKCGTNPRFRKVQVRGDILRRKPRRSSRDLSFDTLYIYARIQIVFLRDAPCCHNTPAPSRRSLGRRKNLGMPDLYLLSQFSCGINLIQRLFCSTADIHGAVNVHGFHKPGDRCFCSGISEISQSFR